MGGTVGNAIENTTKTDWRKEVNVRKTISELVDELGITNCKIFALMDKGNDLEKIKKLNAYRSELKNAINEFFNERSEVKV